MPSSSASRHVHTRQERRFANGFEQDLILNVEKDFSTGYNDFCDGLSGPCFDSLVGRPSV